MKGLNSFVNGKIRFLFLVCKDFKITVFPLPLCVIECRLMGDVKGFEYLMQPLYSISICIHLQYNALCAKSQY